MERKTIRINQDTYKDLSFDEILEMYHALIVNYINKFQAMFKFYMIEYDDLYQEFSMALYKAYRLYDVSKDVGFGLVAKKYLTHKSMNISKVNSATKRRNKYYHEVEIDLFYNLEAPDTTEDCLNNIVVNNYINRLCDRDRKVLQYRQKGMYIYEIQKKLDISRQYIGLISFRHKKNIKKELMLGGVNLWH